MKHLYLLLFFTLIPFGCLFAQFRVATDGSATVSTSEGEVALSGTHNIIGIKGIRTSYNTNSEWGYGIYGTSYNFYTHHSVGVAGIATTEGGQRYNNCKAYGVWGEAKLAETGYNYGVFGRLSDEYFGAAIYGTTDINDVGEQVGGRYAGYFNGNVYVSDHLHASFLTSSSLYSNNWLVEANDAETSIDAISADKISSLSDKIAQLSAISFKGKEGDKQPLKNNSTTYYSGILENNEERTHYTLSTTQMEAVFPELVYSGNEKDRYINYAELIPILVQSIAELKAEIAVLKGYVAGNTISKTHSNLTRINSFNDADTVYLSQNTPNPWSANTNIVINIPEDIVNAELCFYNLGGTLIYSQKISHRGVSSLTLTESEFEPGIYVYALIANGNIVDTKRMIVEK
ncbi:MAG: T9SS type A sorting domain-containing protein [Clostridia bacterium]|nr:T9SS type A sorting domain-containing protein [Clostridia bacterium]